MFYPPTPFHFTGNSFLVFYKSINLRMVGNEEYWFFFKDGFRGTGVGLILAACCQTELSSDGNSSTTHRRSWQVILAVLGHGACVGFAHFKNLQPFHGFYKLCDCFLTFFLDTVSFMICN